MGRGEVGSGFGTMYTNTVKNNSHENIQAWLFFSGWYASLSSYLSISDQFYNMASCSMFSFVFIFYKKRFRNT